MPVQRHAIGYHTVSCYFLAIPGHDRRRHTPAGIEVNVTLLFVNIFCVIPVFIFFQHQFLSYNARPYYGVVEFSSLNSRHLVTFVRAKGHGLRESSNRGGQNGARLISLRAALHFAKTFPHPASS